MTKMLFIALLSGSLLLVGMQEEFRPRFLKTDKASTRAAALLALAKAGYKVHESELVRRGSHDTGAGYWDARIDVDGQSASVMCYGPGEYLNQTCHQNDTLFKVTHGACDFWLLEKDARFKLDLITVDFDLETGEPHLFFSSLDKWRYQSVLVGQEIKVPAKNKYYLVADDQEGLCMHTSLNNANASVEVVKELEIPNSMVADKYE